MRAIQSFSGGVLADILRRQPASRERTRLAWQLAVGPALARVTSVEMDGTTLTVSAQDARWLKEIDRARAAILPRLQQMLGRDSITQISTR
jgi:predicted nucleic acid-binding Zn ribbon protein